MLRFSRATASRNLTSRRPSRRALHRSIDQSNHNPHHQPLNKVRHRLFHRQLPPDIQVNKVVHRKRPNREHSNQRAEPRTLHHSRSAVINHRVKYRQHHDRHERRRHCHRHVFHLSFARPVHRRIFRELRLHPRHRHKHKAPRNKIRNERTQGRQHNSHRVHRLSFSIQRWTRYLRSPLMRRELATKKKAPEERKSSLPGRAAPRQPKLRAPLPPRRSRSPHIVELLVKRVIPSACFRKTQRLHALHADLRRLRRALQNFHALCDVVLQRHGVRIACLSRSRQFRLHVRRDQL